MIVVWLAVTVCVLGTAVCLLIGRMAHVRDQQTPREVSAHNVTRITRDRS